MSEFKDRQVEIRAKYNELVQNVEDLKRDYDYPKLRNSFEVFDMQSQIQLVERLNLSKKMNSPWFGKILNYGTFVSIIREFDLFNKNRENLLDISVKLLDIERAIEAVNSYIKANKGFLEVQTYPRNPDLFRLCHEYIEKASEMDVFDRAHARASIIKEALLDLPAEKIKEGITKKIITAKDVTLIETPIIFPDDSKKSNFEVNFKLCKEAFKLAQPEISNTENFTTRLVGVTMENDDKTKRQDIIKELKSKGLPASVDIKKGTYNDKPCYSVLYNSRCVGFLSQNEADNINAAYPDNEICGTITKVTGGANGMSLGCEIEVSILLDKKTETTKEQSEDKIAS